MAFVLKVSCEGNVLRKRYSSASEVSRQGIDESIKAFFGLKAYTATYQDEDGNWLSLFTQSDLDDALAASSPKALLRLHVARATEEHPFSEGPSLSPDALQEVTGESTSASAPDREEASDGRLTNSENGKVPSMPIETLPLEGSHGGTLAETPCEDSSFVIPENVPTFAMDTPVQSPRQAHSTGDDLLSHSVSGLEVSLEPKESEEGSTSKIEACEPLPEEVGKENVHSTGYDPLSNSVSDVEDSPEAKGSEEESTSGIEGGDKSLLEEMDKENAALTPEEKVHIILAAFDKNEDGHSDYNECNSLQLATSSRRLSKKEFKSLCHQLGQDESVGFDIEALLNLYEVYGTLDGDFDAALRKLGKQSEQQAGCGKGHCHKPCRISPFLALPAALALGPLAGAAVLALSHCSRK